VDTAIVSVAAATRAAFNRSKALIQIASYGPPDWKAVRSFAIRLIILIGIGLTLCGCEFNPAETIQSPTKPEPVKQDEITWIAVPQAGTSDRWFWLPEQVAAVSQNTPWVIDYPIDVIAGGKVWQVTKTSDSGFAFQQDVEAQIDANVGLVVFTIFACIGLIVSLGFNWNLSNARTDEKRTAAELTTTLQTVRSEAERPNRELEYEQKKLKQQQASFRQQQEAAAHAHAAERATLNASRAELEQQKRTLAVAARDQSVAKKPMSGDDWRAASEGIRGKAFSGQAIGHALVVRYFLDPRQSGSVLFQWEITLDRPIPPTFTAYRDGTKIRQESGVVRGEFNERLTNPRKRYQYRFVLLDRGKEMPDVVSFELILPPCPAWEPPPPRTESVEDRQQKREAWRQEQYRHLTNYVTDPETLKIRKAEIDAEVCEKFGEH
jgi:hypothetical protein